MGAIVRRLPFFDSPTVIETGRWSVRVKRDQIIVWISISEMDPSQFDARIPRIPAILDTGCNHNLVIAERHLSEWAGIDARSFPRFADTHVLGRTAAQYGADVWLHRNRPGRREPVPNDHPLVLQVSPGIAVVPTSSAVDVYPRMPLLGLRAFRHRGMRITVDCDRSSVTIRTRRRFWAF